MRVSELLARLSKVEAPGYPRGAYLQITEADELEYVGPAEPLTDDIRRFVRDHRDAILAFLRTPISEMPAEDLAAFDYRPSGVSWNNRDTIPVTDALISAMEKARQAGPGSPERPPQERQPAATVSAPPQPPERRQGEMW